MRTFSSPNARSEAAVTPQAELQPKSQAPERSPERIDQERFVGFAFAGADLLAEVDATGRITFAAGAFRTKFGRACEEFVGQSIRDLITPSDHELLEASLTLLVARGRLWPLVVQLANPDRTQVALAGVSLPMPGAARRLCLSFARPPAPLARMRSDSTPHGLARAAEARLREGERCSIGLIELTGGGSAAIASGDAVGHALQTIAPDAITSVLAPGRYGLVGPPGIEADLLAIVARLETALQGQGVAITARHLAIPTEDLTPTQAARALRQALDIFARDGAAGLGSAGFDGGFAGYLRRACTRTTTLRQVIRRNQFSMAYQPIVALKDHATHYYEALIRPMPTPDSAFASPQDFVMSIEALGLAHDLDLAVARAVCADAARTGHRISFNLSGQSVQSADFRERLLELLGNHPAVTAGLLLVEMTETAEIDDVDEALRTATALRALRIPFCLDDFGAGAADIRLLRALQPNIVKLDGSYIPGVAHEGRERALIAGMVEVARAGGASIVAERVETAAESTALQQLGVSFGQGWLFGKAAPLPPPRKS